MISSYQKIIPLIASELSVNDAELKQLHVTASDNSQQFFQTIINHYPITPERLLELSQHVTHAPLVDVSAVELAPDLIKKFDANIIRKHHILPLFSRADTLFIATFDAFNQSIINMFRFSQVSQFSAVEIVLALPEHIERVLNQQLSDSHIHHFHDTLLDDTRQEELARQEIIKLSQSINSGLGEKEAPIVRYVSDMLLDAIRIQASDIHFEPYENSFRVRYRLDGVLTEVSAPPSPIANRIITRLKVMSGINIAEKRIPQDGRIKLALSEHQSIDFRVSTLPTLWGEKVVLRILDNRRMHLSIDELGFHQNQKSLFLQAIRKPQGIILVTGPTGSGKTVSMYSGLNLINQPEINISTAEDPVEITLTGINQVNIAPQKGLTFAKALRAFLRQDPDVIMVGEIRDLETAEIALKAAQTGHLVLSTLHTNDAPQTLNRLANMGVSPYNIAASIELIIAQRLVRCLCPYCKIRDRRWSAEQLIELGFSADEAQNTKLYQAHENGCEQCSNQGYRGRTGIFQVIHITPALSEMIMNGATSMEFATQCQKEGFWDLRQSGLDKVKQSITSLQEVLRTTIE